MVSPLPLSHTFDTTCGLVPTLTPEPPDKHLAGIPPIRAQFFYSSSIPIDDPLSPATSTSSGTNDAHHTGSRQHPLRPFSPADNAALERAWISLGIDKCRRDHEQAVRAGRGRGTSPERWERDVAERVGEIVKAAAKKHWEKHGKEPSSSTEGTGAQNNGTATTGTGGLTAMLAETVVDIEDNSVQVCCTELMGDVEAELRKEFCPIARRKKKELDLDRVVEAVMGLMGRWKTGDSCATTDGAVATVAAGNTSAAGLSIGASSAPVMQVATSLGSISRISVGPENGNALGSSLPVGSLSVSHRDDGITGKPFVRVEPTSRSNRSSMIGTPDERGIKGSLRGRPRGSSHSSTKPSVTGKLEGTVEIPVGISRLHMVSLPQLQMKPIYWSPVNDVATVLRATWFYRDTMVPVEPIIANQLEAGYRELRPWTETWSDELRSAIDVGALGEEKVSHRLWPEIPEKRSKPKDNIPPQPSISADPICAARCSWGEAAAEGTLKPVHTEDETGPLPPESIPYANYHVIYKDATTAFLLKPSQKPSAYYGRRPVSKILKGITVGIPVVRGFDRDVWEKVHNKRASYARAAQEFSLASRAAEARQTAEQNGCCPACQLEKDRGRVTDLVLVIHGIGQKFAERVESFHFTHAVSALRRAVNIELQSPVVKAVLRPEHRGIMVLPVNWRHLLSFEDGGPTAEGDHANPEGTYPPEGFALKDIEPPTIPAVRGMISDIMFDIPFYMSHHKPKMIAAMVGEANRVYRLWCRNNPGFAEHGRVHLIAHSLGSVMAIEVLSRQPTRVTCLDLKNASPVPDTRYFEFDTTNLFLLGSPAAFFLLLERGARLLPRRGRMKPGAEAAATVAKEIVGDVGQFGCLAVDNVYNILAKEDPIAYLLNGTIDPYYAASLKTAYVPSTSTSFFERVGDVMVRSITGTTPRHQYAQGPGQQQPQSPPSSSKLNHLPSQLELEIHDFTREEIAEKKAFLLNDNGQIDYYLRSGGGPLEIQYLNMLSAHTSYWTNQDLVRFLCIEIGRRPGKENTLVGMRAVKAKGGFVGALS
ncbi:uncharacterized protein CTHT_0002920 [Thermochaetoides thermophila DSM 1495]|uniref:DDHD domain-containing protein n=1 Tax=Chaetomium thermophilum (strain DSM 1495 / CBS 144.50 / IMI 039719) TaxID=759272 RepID=G0RZG9_CHATD|nr:hypothetical protein CTHT_0002920 [Thermochaetoides thermophila DSM 1495]EGS23597.1 hypothetical protein CTHT_0002920 [Thermochaetoides thermophila DSM 1495]